MDHLQHTSTRETQLFTASLPFDGATPVGRGPGADRAAAAGRMLATAWAGGVHPLGVALPAAEVFSVLADRTVSSADLDTAWGLIGSQLSHHCDLREQGWQRLWTEAGRFRQFLEVAAVADLAAVSPEAAYEFIELPVATSAGGWADPGVATMRTRRGAIRLVYGTGRFLGLVTGDPTIDIHFAANPPSGTRPLTDDEVFLGRSWSRLTLVSTRHAAAWAVGEATATNSELAAVRVHDIDLDAGTVELHGNEKWRDPRVGELSEWGVDAIRRHLDALNLDPAVGIDPDRLQLTDASASRNSGQSSTNQLIAATMTHAGLRADKSVKPVSLSMWAGRKVLDETGRIDLAARTVGMRDLGRAARALRFEW